MRILKYSIIIILIIGGLVLIVNQAFLYSSKTTHPYLTEEIVKFYNYYYDPDITPQQLEQMKKGSSDEDTWPRNWFYHFYDPLHPGSETLSAKEWAQSPEKQVNVPGGDHSWQTAISEYNAGYKQKAFYSLGHILHLIEDMAVPAHTRNDAHHVGGDPLEDWAGKLPRSSELYNIANPLINQNIRPRFFNNLDAYFDELANFSNRNFFSKDTIKDTIDINTGRIIPIAKYFEPKIVKEKRENGKKYGYGKVSGSSELIRLVRIREDKSGKLYFIKDDYRNEDSPEIHADYFRLLARETVINGAGVVKLFFDSVAELEQEIIEPEKKLSFFQKVGNRITGFAKFVYSVIDGLIYTPPAAINSVMEESIPESEFMTTSPWVIDEIMEISDKEGTKPPTPPVGGFVPSLSDGDETLQSFNENENQIQPFPESKPQEENQEGKKESFLVKRVIDGDTIVLDNGQEVRYIGIDAPEFSNGCFAEESTNKNKELLEGKKVRLEKDISETDSYGRLLRYVYLGDLFVNDYLVRNGYAYDFAYEPDTKHKERFIEAEEEAKKNRKGLWGDVCHPLIEGTEEQKENGFQVVQGSKTGGSGGVSLNINQEAQDQSQNQEGFEQQEEQPEQQEQQQGEQEEGFEGQQEGEQEEGDEDNKGEEQEKPEEQGEQEQQEIEYGDVVINEIAWMGTEANYTDEWIELYNKTSQSIDLTNWILEGIDGTPSISLTASISVNGYYLLERSEDDQAISNIEADQAYTGALNNEGENLVLKDNSGNIIDQVDCSEGWYAGDNEEKRTMERISFLSEESVSVSWQTYSGSGSNFLDAEGNPIFGTPKAENSITNSESEESDQEESEEETADEEEENVLYTAVTQNITEDTTWTLANSPYLIYDNNGNPNELLEIAENTILTIEAGVIVKFVNPGLKVFGTIEAEGTSENPIIFTDYNDKEYAGEFFDNSDNPQPGAWSGIWITESSTDSVFDNVIVRYAGSRTRPFRSGSTYSPVAVGAGIRVKDTSITIRSSIIELNLFKGIWLENSSNTLIENSTFQNHLEDQCPSPCTWNDWQKNIALYIDSSSPKIENSVFQNNITSIYMVNSNEPIIENNQFSGNSYTIWVQNSYPEFLENQIEGNSWDGIVLQGMKLDRDYTLGGGSVFINYESIPSWSIVVPEGYTLTIESGTIIKSVNSTSGLQIEGTLIAEGIATKPIVFTSFYDDEYGGDTNSDGGATTAQSGSWGQIVFAETSIDSILDYVVIRYGGTKWGGSWPGPQADYVLDIASSDITLANSIIENNTSGCRLENSNSYIANTIFQNHRHEGPPFSYFTSTGIKLVSSTSTIDLSTFLNNKLGIYIDAGSLPTLLNLIFTDNTQDTEDLRQEEEEEGGVEIIDVFYDGVEEGEADEYVEIKNFSDADVDLEYWSLSDEAGHEFTFPYHNLEPGESIRVYTNMGDFNYESGTAIWNNNGDTAYLKNRGGELIDSYSY